MTQNLDSDAIALKNGETKLVTFDLSESFEKNDVGYDPGICM